MIGNYYEKVFDSLEEAKKMVNFDNGEDIIRVLWACLPGESVFDGYGPVVVPTEKGYFGTYDLYEIEQKDGFGRFLWVRHLR